MRVIRNHNNTQKIPPLPLKSGEASLAMSFDENLTIRLNRLITTTRKSLREISEETQIPLLWLASVKNGVPPSLMTNKSEESTRTERLKLLLDHHDSQETKTKLSVLSNPSMIFLTFSISACLSVIAIFSISSVPLNFT